MQSNAFSYRQYSLIFLLPPSLPQRCTYSHFVDMISSCSSAVIAIRIMSENLHEITTTASSTLAAFLSEGDGHKEETREDGETVVPEGVIEKEIEHMLKKVQKDEKVWR